MNLTLGLTTTHSFNHYEVMFTLFYKPAPSSVQSAVLSICRIGDKYSDVFLFLLASSNPGYPASVVIPQSLSPIRTRM